MPSSDTPQPLPVAVKVDELFDGVRYRLPVRDLRRLRLVGLASLLIGTSFCRFAVWSIIRSLVGARDAHGPAPGAQPSRERIGG